MEPKSDAGAAAEARAARHLEEKGWTILERNFRAKVGELDIVARDGECVVFVEVRSRAGAAFGGAAASVDFRKRRKLLKAAQLYALKHGLDDCPMRFDVVVVEAGRLDHLEDAFSN